MRCRRFYLYILALIVGEPFLKHDISRFAQEHFCMLKVGLNRCLVAELCKIVAREDQEEEGDGH